MKKKMIMAAAPFPRKQEVLRALITSAATFTASAIMNGAHTFRFYESEAVS
jgi:hypothetical protein